jgi:hypothetical protein
VVEPKAVGANNFAATHLSSKIAANATGDRVALGIATYNDHAPTAPPGSATKLEAPDSSKTSPSSSGHGGRGKGIASQTTSRRDEDPLGSFQYVVVGCSTFRPVDVEAYNHKDCSDDLALARELSNELTASLPSEDAMIKLREEAPEAYASMLVRTIFSEVAGRK